jgi:hypothetical protein
VSIATTSSARRRRRRTKCLHGHSRRGQRTTTYDTWRSMRQRCWNPHHARFADYGGRGITIDERWWTFRGFLSSMGERPAGTTLDRCDKDGPYAPGNCRWATPSQQNRNRRPQQLHHCRCGYFAPHACPCQGQEREADAA